MVTYVCIFEKLQSVAIFGIEPSLLRRGESKFIRKTDSLVQNCGQVIIDIAINEMISWNK